MANVEFIVADAQTHDFGAGTCDLVIAQFGLMFFDDPVRAFTNLHRALVPGGSIMFANVSPAKVMSRGQRTGSALDLG